MATDKFIAFNSLQSVEWKLGVTASSSESQKIGQTFVQVKMTVRTEDNSTASSANPKTESETTPLQSVDTMQIEMSIPKFYEFLTEMEKSAGIFASCKREMSHQYYADLWRQAHLELDALLMEDKVDLFTKLKNELPRLIFEVLAGLYLRYLQVYKKFDACLDQMAHPQKRILLRNIVDSLIGRIQELKFEMVNIEQSDFQYLYNYAMELGHSITDLELVPPRYILNDRYDNLQERDALLEKYAEKRESILIRKRAMKAAQAPSTSAEEMALRMERSRQAWLYVSELIKSRKETLNHREAHKKFTGFYSAAHIDAALRIQAFWKAAKTGKMTKNLRRKELQVLNVVPSDSNHTLEHEAAIEAIKEERRVLQRQNQKQYEEQQGVIKEQLKDTETPGIVNHIETQIRQWFLEYRDATGSFPDFPSVDDGGSASLFERRNPQEIAAELDKLRLEREKAEAEAAEEARLAAEGKGKDKKGKKGGKDGKGKDKKGGKDDKKKKDKEDKKKKGVSKDGKKGKGKKKGEEEDLGWKPLIPQSAFIPTMNESMIIYHDFWERRDDKANLNQEFDSDIVRAEKRKELRDEIRMEVDESMRKEVDYLKLSIDGQKPKKKKKKKKGKKKGKKGKKGKKEKDLTPNRTHESIFEELAMNNILQSYPLVQMKDYWGSVRFIGEQLREANYDFDKPLMPQAEEIRNALVHYCVLPTVSISVREKVPPVKSLLLAGPPHNGKHMLADAVCTALGATKFLLDLNYIKSMYKGKAGITMLLHLIRKLGRIFQPSVIVIDHAEYLFSKKAPKTFKSEYKAIKKDLHKYIKKMPLEDRIFVLGITSSPTECKPKGASGFFNKIIPVPLPDYHARVAIINNTLERQTGLNFLAMDQFLIPTVAKITQGATSTQLIDLAKAVVKLAHPPQRGAGDQDMDATLDKRIINLDNFVSLTSELKMFAGKPLDQYEAWYAKLPINKKRRLVLEDKLGINDPPDKNKKKGASKKKK